MAQAARPKPKQEWLADGVRYRRLTDFFDDPQAIRRQGGQLQSRAGSSSICATTPAAASACCYASRACSRRRGRRSCGLPAAPSRQTLAIDADVQAFTGTVAVLVDARSGLSAQALARLLQQRGARVSGDCTMGAVTGAVLLEHAAGEGDIKALYGMLVTVTDLLMPDGSRLEGVGVQPDTVSLPSPETIPERGLDPVLTQAASSFGVTLDAKRAGRLSRQ